MIHGVNYFGSSKTSDGIGRAAALNIRALMNAGIPHDVFPLSRPVALQEQQSTIIDDLLLSNLRNKINIFHFSARWVPHYFSQIRECSLSSHYNIGYWVCEVPRIPDEWAEQFKYFDEIWTASAFCQTAISRTSTIPVIRIPHPIDFQPLNARIAQQRKSSSRDPFTFLTIFNTYSDAERKNALFTIRAFLRAHGDRADVRLVVKASNLEHDPVLREKLMTIATEHANVEIIEGYLPDDFVSKLYERADAYVSLHRAEGFGLTISDAMSRGIPVIATAYSGNLDFCEPGSARLVNYHLRPVGHERLRYKKTDLWAEPDLQDATNAFREIESDYPAWLLKARSARERIQQDFSLDAIGKLMAERLSLIDGNFRYEHDMEARHLDREVGIYETYGF